MASAIVGNLIGSGGGQLLDGVSHIINSIKGRNPEDAAKLQELLSKHQDLVLQADVDLEKARIQSNVDLNAIAGQNVRADAQSGDKYTSRARPSIIYVGLFVMAFNYVVMAILTRWGFKIAELPSAFWEAWTVVACGVVMARSYDKTMGGAGGSVSGFGLKAESKGD